MSDTLESRSGQLQYRNFRSGSQADGKDGSSDTAVDVELATRFFVQTADVGSVQSVERDAAFTEIQRQLTAVRVSGQHQVETVFDCPIETGGNGHVGQKNVDRVRHDQVIDP